MAEETQTTGALIAPRQPFKDALQILLYIVNNIATMDAVYLYPEEIALLDAHRIAHATDWGAVNNRLKKINWHDRNSLIQVAWRFQKMLRQATDLAEIAKLEKELANIYSQSGPAVNEGANPRKRRTVLPVAEKKFSCKFSQWEIGPEDNEEQVDFALCDVKDVTLTTFVPGVFGPEPLLYKLEMDLCMAFGLKPYDDACFCSRHIAAIESRHWKLVVESLRADGKSDSEIRQYIREHKKRSPLQSTHQLIQTGRAHKMASRELAQDNIGTVLAADPTDAAKRHARELILRAQR